ncbi:MAG: hypothetical protein JRH20_21495, partial [Deltaproteobacteria bacterium]|nr:hypothetical protein [Deltaproteobacteria bacterium]
MKPGLLLLFSLLLACDRSAAGVTPSAEKNAHTHLPLASVRIAGIPHVHQKPDFCGEAVVAAALKHEGHHVTQDEVFALTGVDPALGRGAYTKGLKRAVEAFGYSPGRVWQQVKTKHASSAMQQQFRALHTDLKAGIPSIVCT